jgi:uncharacterized membrane protein HdeD (DUF308 family)
MTEQLTTHTDDWLKRYYFTRAAFSIAWVIAAFALAHSAGAIVAALLLVYPTWDAAANVVDAQRNGGLAHNPSQLVNAIASTAATVAIAVAMTSGRYAVLAVFGVWAILAGLLQLATGARRWKANRGQWAMILSGAQSAFAGVHFLTKAHTHATPDVTVIAPYAAFGALYFLIAALWLLRRTERN